MVRNSEENSKANVNLLKLLYNNKLDRCKIIQSEFRFMYTSLKKNIISILSHSLFKEPTN